MTKSDIQFQIELAIEDAVINSNSEHCSREQAKQEISQAQSIVLEYFNDMYEQRHKQGFMSRGMYPDLDYVSEPSAIVSTARSFLRANDERTLAYYNNNSENAFEIECDQRDDGTILAEWIIQSKGGEQ